MKDYSLKINGNQYDISIEDVNENRRWPTSPSMVSLTSGNRRRAGQQDEKPQAFPAPKAAGLSVTPTTAAPSAPKAAQAAAGGPGLQVKSPLPGTILSVNVKEGDRVAPRQTLFVLEAMKMETTSMPNAAVLSNPSTSRRALP